MQAYYISMQVLHFYASITFLCPTKVRQESPQPFVCNPTVFLASNVSRYKNMQSTKMMTEASSASDTEEKILSFFLYGRSITTAAAAHVQQIVYKPPHTYIQQLVHTQHNSEQFSLTSLLGRRQCFQMLIVLRTGLECYCMRVFACV